MTLFSGAGAQVNQQSNESDTERKMSQETFKLPVNLQKA